MTKTAVLEVRDMTCAHCELSVQEALDEIPGVQRAKANHKEGTVEVTYEGARATNEQFKQAIEQVGYTVAT